MSSDEEYLDSLLKSMSDQDEEDNDEKMMSLMDETDPMKKKSDPKKKEVFSDIRPDDQALAADPANTEADTETKEDWSTPEEKNEDQKKPVVDESWKAELDEMLAKADQAQEALGEIPEDSETDSKPEEGQEAKAAEENKNSWRSKETEETEETEESVPLHTGSEETETQKGLPESEETEESDKSGKKEKKKREKKKKHSLFGRKKKDTAKESAEQASPTGDTLPQDEQKSMEEAQPSSEFDEIPGFKELQERAMKESEEEGATGEDKEVDWTSLLGGNGEPQEQTQQEDFEEPDWADEIPEKKVKKKTGFLSKILEALFREEPEEEQGETEETPVKKEKKKKKKDKEKAKDKKTEAEGDEEAEGKEVTDKKAEKKKAKQQKKEEKKRQKEQEPKQPKVLNRKSLFTLIAFDATVIAAVLLFGIFLPDYIDRRNAREAFYTGDYTSVYQDLYGKRIGESDSVLLNRADVVEKLQRKLDSCEINMRTGNQAQALDALLSGVAAYDSIMAEGAAYGAEDELSALYQQITDTLQEQFQVDEATAREVIAYEDDDDYSEAVYSLINSGKLPGEETEEAAEAEDGTKELKDFLPEEEDMVDTSF